MNNKLRNQLLWMRKRNKNRKRREENGEGN
jgi:hypothetical protein